MKKIFCVVLILLLALCGCGKKQKVKPKLNDISFVADISYKNEEFSLKTNINKKSKMTSSVIIPSDFKDLKFIFEGDKKSAEFMGLSYMPQKGNIPAFGVASIIYDVIKSIPDNAEIKVNSGENCEIKGKIGIGEYIFTFSPAGLPLKLQIPDIGYTAVFSSLTLI